MNAGALGVSSVSISSPLNAGALGASSVATSSPLKAGAFVASSVATSSPLNAGAFVASSVATSSPLNAGAFVASFVSVSTVRKALLYAARAFAPLNDAAFSIGVVTVSVFGASVSTGLVNSTLPALALKLIGLIIMILYLLLSDTHCLKLGKK